MPRIRLQNNLNQSTRKATWLYYKPNGTYYRTDNFSCKFPDGSFAYMSDDISRPKSRKTKRVDHITCCVESRSVSGRYYFPGPYGLGYFEASGFGPTVDLDPMAFPWNPTESSLAAARIEALRFFESGCTKEVLTLGNFIRELPEVLSLKDQAKQLVRMVKTMKKRSTLELFQGAGNAHLATQFGVLPLISDIMSIVDSVRHLGDHIAWLRKDSGQIVRREFCKKLETVRPPNTPHTDSYNTFYEYNELSCFFKAFCTIQYDLSQINDIELSLRLLTKTFGLNNILSTLWNGCPYTFVVDWILGIGSWLDRFSIPVVLPYTIHDLGHSTKTVMDYTVYFNSWPSYGNPFKKIQHVRKTAYSRAVGLPTPVSALDLSTPSAKQFVLGLCLGLQKL